MPRTLTIPAIRDAQREHGQEVFLLLVEIDTLIAGPDRYIYIVNNTENIISNGVEYLGCPFSISLPDSNDYTTEQADIEIDNVDPRIWQSLRALNESPWMTLRVILASDPDTVVLTSTGLRLREADANKTTISAKIITDTIWQGGFPAHDFDPSQNPGMFVS